MLDDDVRARAARSHLAEAARERFPLDLERIHVLIQSALLFGAGYVLFDVSSALALPVGLWCGYCVAYLGIGLIGRRPPISSNDVGVVLGITLSIVIGATVGRRIELALWQPQGLQWSDEALRFGMHLAFVGGFVLIPLVRSMAAAQRLARSEEERARLTSRLIALQAQIEPHFLFNTLATLRSLIRRDAAVAAELLDRMTSFLRAVLPDARQTESTVAREIAIVESYLAIMQLRLGTRLAYSIDAAPDTLAASAPPLLLQPLVENAIKHGIEPSQAGGSIAITTRVDAGELTIEVRNTGEALRDRSDESDLEAPGVHTGLRNVRNRLAALYAHGASLSLLGDPDGATIATLRIPVASTA
jgi:hypothetical protein